MSLLSHELQLQMEVPIWPYYKVETKDEGENIKVTFSAFIRKEIESVMYKTLHQLQFTFIKDDNEKIAIDRLTIRFHSDCYMFLIIGKPSMQEVDKDTRTELVRITQELI